MSETVIPFPRPFKPHPVSDTEALLFGGPVDGVSPFTAYADTLPHWEREPRRHFGLAPATGAALFNVRAADIAQQQAFKAEARGGEDRVKRAAEKAAVADGRTFSDPELDKELSAQVAHFAEVALMLSDRIARAGHARQSVTMRDIASFSETISAELLIPHTPEIT